MRTSVSLALAFVLVGCSSGAAKNDTSTDGDVGVDEAEVGTVPACVGTACPSLALPAPLRDGGLAISGSKLGWIEPGTAGVEGYATHVLATCVLPACAAVQRVTLSIDGGASLWVENRTLTGTASGFAFVGRTGLASESRTRVWVTDGSAPAKPNAGPVSNSQLDRVVLDARSSAHYDATHGKLLICPLEVTLPAEPCVQTLRNANMLALGDTRLLVDRTTTIESWDRATLASTSRQEEPFWDEVDTGLAYIGATPYAISTRVSTRAGHAVHDTSFRPPGNGAGATVHGVSTNVATSGVYAYVTTIGEGDVHHADREGVVARVREGVAAARVVAKQQNAYAPAVSATNVYWLDVDASEMPKDEPRAVVRYAPK